MPVQALLRKNRRAYNSSPWMSYVQCTDSSRQPPHFQIVHLRNGSSLARPQHFHKFQGLDLGVRVDSIFWALEHKVHMQH
jgi:hypothetical protein